ncbi:MAG: hypothetical protein FD143_3191 [Ignavibacteria bacterium]|nr:MAG: hypothetical protein FD143_3191 [Ignavibacteria bacterium]
MYYVLFTYLFYTLNFTELYYYTYLFYYFTILLHPVPVPPTRLCLCAGLLIQLTLTTYYTYFTLPRAGPSNPTMTLCRSLNPINFKY